MNVSVYNMRTKIEQRKGARDELLRQRKELKAKRKGFIIELDAVAKAQAILQKVAQLTQQELEYHISEIVSLALKSIFSDPYEFQLDFVQRRNKTEADIWFSRDDERIHPLTASGGGAVDVAAFALRIALWRLRTPRTRNTLVLDEPFRFLSADLLPKASELLKGLSDKLGLQIIMITHSEELTDAADRTFKVSQRNRVSKVEVV